MDDIITGAGNIQDDPDLVGPESTQLVKYIKNKYSDECMLKEYRSQLKELPMAKAGAI